MQFSDKFHNIHWKNLITAVAIPLAAGGLSAWITMDGMKAFETVNQPPLTPPMWLFPVVWSILYALMGYASYLVLTAPAARDDIRRALFAYGAQLLVNLLWPVVFFNLRACVPAFVVLVLLWALIGLTAARFRPLSRRASLLLLPYWLWVTFAGHLNLSICLLN